MKRKIILEAFRAFAVSVFGSVSFGYIDVLVKRVNPNKLPNRVLGNSTTPLQGIESGPCNAYSEESGKERPHHHRTAPHVASGTTATR